MRNRTGRYIFAILLFTFFSGAAVIPVNAAAAQSQAASTAPATGGKQDWDAVVAAAKKEGKVSVYAMWSPQVRMALTEAFKARHGIEVEFTPFSRGQEIQVKMQTEQRAGLYLADVLGAGGNTFIGSMKPAGILGSIEPLLMLPEVTDAKYWSGGKFPFVDKDKTSIAMIAHPVRHIFYNTNLIRKGELTTYKDVLKPQYKRKIILDDPTGPGSGKDLLVHLATNLWTFDEAKAFLSQLVTKQEVQIEKNNRQLVDSVARGKYAIGLGANPDVLSSFIKVGAPLDLVILKEGVRVSGSAGYIAIPKRLAHPNAAKLFINWLLTKEGQTVVVKSFSSPSARNDVSTEGLNPVFLTHPGEKIYSESEEAILFAPQVMKAAKLIIDSANK